MLAGVRYSDSTSHAFQTVDSRLLFEVRPNSPLSAEAHLRIRIVLRIYDIAACDATILLGNDGGGLTPSVLTTIEFPVVHDSNNSVGYQSNITRHCGVSGGRSKVA